VPTVSKTVPTLRDISLDGLNAIAKALSKADPSLTPQQAMLKAVDTPAGRTLYTLYSLPPQITGTAGTKPANQDGLKRMTKARSAPSVVDIYSRLQAQAMAAAPGKNPADAVSEYVKTPAGRVAWRRYEDARSAAGEGN
jgi:hypothetical protein